MNEGLSTHEPMPTPDPERGNVQDLVIADIEERKRVGIARYGTPLQTFNGRNALVDAYQEALDLCMYLRQKIEEDAHLAAFVNRTALAVHPVDVRSDLSQVTGRVAAIMSEKRAPKPMTITTQLVPVDFGGIGGSPTPDLDPHPGSSTSLRKHMTHAVESAERHGLVEGVVDSGLDVAENLPGFGAIVKGVRGFANKIDSDDQVDHAQ